MFFPDCLPNFLRLLVKHHDLQLPCYLFFSIVETFPENLGIRSKKLFYRPIGQLIQLIQLVVAIKGDFSGLLFF